MAVHPLVDMITGFTNIFVFPHLLRVIRQTTLVVLQQVLHLSLMVAPDADFAICVVGYHFAVYISQLIRFVRVSSYVIDFNTRNKLLTAKLLNQGYRYHKLRKAFSKFYRRHSDLVSKFNVRLNLFCNKAYRNPNFMVS